ncbi:MAG: PPOX class F420-dependent oxidoreductase [Candidatus Dadabacteria bacterium]|nr:MAG: PPOX class F420-dependent oxidoreductase [Candidatus Dadabacteria bacterium]
MNAGYARGSANARRSTPPSRPLHADRSPGDPPDADGAVQLGDSLVDDNRIGQRAATADRGVTVEIDLFSQQSQQVVGHIGNPHPAGLRRLQAVERQSLPDLRGLQHPWLWFRLQYQHLIAGTKPLFAVPRCRPSLQIIHRAHGLLHSRLRPFARYHHATTRCLPTGATPMSRSDVQQICDATYIAFTTFRKNSERKSTPVWVACDEGKIYIWTNRDTWKVRRLRNNPACEMQPCNVSGKRTFGPVVSGRMTRLLERSEASVARQAFRRKYGWQYWILELLGRLRPGSDHVWLEIEPELARD